MAIKVCPNGHRYDTDTNRTCPYCNSAQSDSNFNWSEMDATEPSRTEPIGGFGGGDGGYSGKTEPINTYGENFGNRNRGGGGADVIGATVPVDISGQGIRSERKLNSVLNIYTQAEGTGKLIAETEASLRNLVEAARIIRG